MDFALHFLNMSLPFESKHRSNIIHDFQSEHNTYASITSYADKIDVCDSVILVMLIVMLICRRSEWI